MSARSHGGADFPLYEPRFEHDACGVGFVARVTGQAEHGILARALEALGNLGHRGAVDADGRSGDGAGVLTALPRELLAREAARLGLPPFDPQALGVIMAFLPREDAERAAGRAAIRDALGWQGLHILGWRDVPIDPSVLGAKARQTMPAILQALVVRPRRMDPEEFERALYLARRAAERQAEEHGLRDFFVPSASSRTIVYKGLLGGEHLAAFYRDLRDPAYETPIAVFHQRYSTNTFPTWALAQPFRLLAHNGEINTLEGNRRWMAAREADLDSPLWGPDLQVLRPVITPEGSDSLSLDETLELLERSGRDLLQALMMLVPEAWENRDDLDPDLRGFYEYHAGLMEPWDGPAALAISDGRWAVAALDRNGLRPSRYVITADGLVVVGSEVGLVQLDEATIVEKGRLGPGQLIAVDTGAGRVYKDAAIKAEVARRRPYRAWVAAGAVRLPEPAGPNGAAHDAPGAVLASARAPGSPSGPGAAWGTPPHPDPSRGADPASPTERLVRLQRAYGFTHEDVKFVVRPMATEGKEPVFSMGDDTPIAPLATRPRPLYSFFRQRFAQVTNPPIDPLREAAVMSLRVELGPRGNLLDESPAQARLVRLASPILTERQLAALRALGQNGAAATVGAREGRSAPAELERPEVARWAPEGAGLDQTAAGAPQRDPGRVEAPASPAAPAAPPFGVATLDATFDPRGGGAALRRGLRALCLRAEAAVNRGAGVLVLSDRRIGPDRAPIPLLLAVGAVQHHLLRAGLRLRCDLVAEAGDAWDAHHVAALLGNGAAAVCPWLALETARAEAGGEEGARALVQALEAGLLKILSKMGISTLASYRGGQLFEILGLDQETVELAFAGTPSRIGGIGLDEIAAQAVERHAAAFSRTAVTLDHPGNMRYRRDGEYHGFNPPLVRALQAVAEENDDEAYRRYLELVEARPLAQLRDLLRIRSDRKPVPLAEVEPAEEIRKRFISTAMSLGALSPEAHRTLAIAMNRMGARSNSGEGGEDPANYARLPNGDRADNKIKQVASARFGVTAEYLVMADELEIKMAQGSKPGEGGQLPGHKVTELIARLRHAVPGIALISPPPHHDIYSIEDIAQLIYDLKQVNPRAKVGVKLVAQVGVGTVAAGVAKAYADYVLISGHSGGTGASPYTSIKHAGAPWELGLAETQQVLVRNNLRGRVSLRTDGGLQTGRDVVIAALLGAEEFGFGTAAVVALGCDMARQCHLNTCPTGIATQRPELRAKFRGTPEQVIHFFTHLAEDVRRILARMGYRRLDDLIGRADLLEQAEHRAGIDCRAIITPADASRPLRRLQERNDRPEPEPLGAAIARLVEPHVERGEPFDGAWEVRNRDRAVGARVAGLIARRWGDAGLPAGTITLRFRGSAGQSFGAFAARGMRLVLEGDANDYVGKGLSGGEIVVFPPREAQYAADENVIIGNVVLYGATAGRLFAAGRAGERFAVRNSGAVAVVEGIGDHGCEYMTGGVVVVLGETGRNFGAGMTNGVAFVYDPSGDFPTRLNPELVAAARLEDPADEVQLRALIVEHHERTGSRRAAVLLEDWAAARASFWKVAPKSAAAPSSAPVGAAGGARA